MPGIIWFYYGNEEYKCKSPIDEDINTIIFCYFLVAILLIIPLIYSLVGHYTAYDLCISMPAVYLVGKIAIQGKMISSVHRDYNSEIGWDKNICPNLESLTLFWLIWNYINISITFIYFIIYIGIGWCECSYYDDYDFE